MIDPPSSTQFRELFVGFTHEEFRESGETIVRPRAPSPAALRRADKDASTTFVRDFREKERWAFPYTQRVGAVAVVVVGGGESRGAIRRASIGGGWMRSIRTTRRGRTGPHVRHRDSDVNPRTLEGSHPPSRTRRRRAPLAWNWGGGGEVRQDSWVRYILRPPPG